MDNNNNNSIQNNKINQEGYKQNFYYKFIKDCVNKLFEKYIKICGNYKRNKTEDNKEPASSFYQFTNEQRNNFIHSISDISSNNDDFRDITNNYLFDPNSKVNRDNLIIEIRTKEGGYYLKKAKLIYKIKVFLIILKTIYLFLLNIENNCIDEVIEKNDENFWFCEIKEMKKCKVVPVYFSFSKFLRIVYFCSFDLIYILYEIYFLNEFKRKSLGDLLLILYQFYRYVLIIIIYSFDFFNHKKCVNSGNDKNLFFKIKNYDFCNIKLIIDIIDFIFK